MAQDDDLLKLLGSVPCVFGLLAQGHIPTIQKMLDPDQPSGPASWEEIGNTIGWCPITAREHYERWALNNSDRMIPAKDVLPLLAAACGIIESLAAQNPIPICDHNIYSTIHYSNKLLESKAKIDIKRKEL